MLKVKVDLDDASLDDKELDCVDIFGSAPVSSDASDEDLNGLVSKDLLEEVNFC